MHTNTKTLSDSTLIQQSRIQETFSLQTMSAPVLVFAISIAVITVWFTDTFTGVSKVRTVDRPHTDYY